MSDDNKLCHIEFICHGNILRMSRKASKINGFTSRRGACYTTITPFGKEF